MIACVTSAAAPRQSDARRERLCPNPTSGCSKLHRFAHPPAAPVPPPATSARTPPFSATHDVGATAYGEARKISMASKPSSAAEANASRK